MIIIDFYNLVSSAVHKVCAEEKIQPDLNTVRTVSLNAVLTHVYKHPHYSKDGVVIAFDTKTNWRMSVFPFYKQNRKKAREKRDFDYQMFYASLEAVKIEFREMLPYKCIEVDGAEADDIISVIARIKSNEKNVCIVSNDKDFLQLQKAHDSSIVQFSPMKDKFISHADIDANLDEHIVGGDACDGVPNVFSDDDVFLREGIKQKPFTASKKAELRAIGLTRYKELQDDVIRARIERNQTLIDLTKIPSEVQRNIIDAFVQSIPSRGTIYGYMVDKGMDVLIERFAGRVL